MYSSQSSPAYSECRMIGGHCHPRPPVPPAAALVLLKALEILEQRPLKPREWPCIIFRASGVSIMSQIHYYDPYPGPSPYWARRQNDPYINTHLGRIWGELDTVRDPLVPIRLLVPPRPNFTLIQLRPQDLIIGLCN